MVHAVHKEDQRERLRRVEVVIVEEVIERLAQLAFLGDLLVETILPHQWRVSGTG